MAPDNSTPLTDGLTPGTPAPFMPSAEEQNVDAGPAPAVPAQAPPTSLAMPGVPASATGPTVKAGQNFPNVSPGAPGSQGQTTDAHHSLIGRAFDQIAKNQINEWVQTPTGPQQVTRNAQPGEFARNILAAALTGLAAGYAPEVRGKGPGAAASAGFFAAQGRKDQLADKAAAQAQTEYKNKQEADRTTLEKGRYDMDWQRHLNEMQEFAHRERMWPLEERNANFNAAANQVRFYEDQDRIAENDKQFGMEKAKLNGEEVPMFDSDTEARDFAVKNMGQLKVNGRLPQLRHTVDPETGRAKTYLVTASGDQAPKDWVLLKGKDGMPQWAQYDGTKPPANIIPGADGKAQITRGKSADDMRLRNSEDQKTWISMRDHALDRELKLLEIGEKKEGKKEVTLWNEALNEYQKAGGKVEDMDPKYKPVFLKGMMPAFTAASNYANSLHKRAEAGENVPADEIAQADATVAYYSRINYQVLHGQPASVSFVTQLQRQGMTTDEVLKHVEDPANKWTPEDRQAARLKALAIPDPKMEARVQLLAQKTEQEASDMLAQAGVTGDVAQSLLEKAAIVRGKRVGATGPTNVITPANPQLAAIPTDQVLLQGPNGTQIVPVDSADAFLQRHPEYKKVGQGTKAPEAPTAIAEK